jgi:CheY-like chemotaxis protein
VFDLLLSDIVMPGMNGYDLAKILANACPKTRVALMSGADPGCDGGRMPRSARYSQSHFFRSTPSRLSEML